MATRSGGMLGGMNKDGGLTLVFCSSEYLLPSRTCLVCRHNIGDEDCENNPFWRHNIHPMDITSSKSELSEWWRVWLRGFTFFCRRKSKSHRASKKEERIILQGRSWSAGHLWELDSGPASRRWVGWRVQTSWPSIEHLFSCTEHCVWKTRSLPATARNGRRRGLVRAPTPQTSKTLRLWARGTRILCEISC